MKYLIDSDFLFGLFVAHDPHHKKTTSLLKSLAGKEHELVVSNLVVQETATVLSRKDN
jgi:predicted nucleic acid-binding protein